MDIKVSKHTDEFIFGDENKQKVLYFVPHADHGPQNNLIETLIKEISCLPEYLLLWRCLQDKKYFST